MVITYVSNSNCFHYRYYYNSLVVAIDMKQSALKQVKFHQTSILNSNSMVYHIRNAHI